MMNQNCKCRAYREYFSIVCGSLLVAVAINSIFEMLSIVIGGVTGIAIIIKELTRNRITMWEDGVPLWLSNLVINIPLFIFAGYKIGKKFLLRTISSTLLVSLFLGIVPQATFLPKDTFLNVIIGAVIMGVGIGMIFSASATTGGTDLLAVLAQKKHPHVSPAILMGLIDAVIVVAGAGLFGLEKAVYAVIAIYIVSKTADNIVDGLKHAKMAYIISNDTSTIAGQILEQLDRGVTSLQIKGMYTEKEKNMLLCVVSKKELLLLKNIVSACDEHAFVIVSDVREALGEGFLNHRT